MAPKVAIVVANHNYGRWLAQALNSVVCQDYPSELLTIGVCDDGSTDKSWEILQKGATIEEEEPNTFAGHWGNVKIFTIRNEKPLGPSAARNRVIKGLMGLGGLADIYGILDADDYFRPEKVKKVVSRFADNPLFGSVYTDYVTVNEQGIMTHVMNDSYSYELLLRRCCVHSGVFIRADVLQKVGGYDETLRTCEDYDLHLRIAEQYVIGHVPEALSVVRVGSHNSTSTVASATWQDNHRKVFEKLRQRQCL
jgi:glycosyltransferase involved in cell wall biosynthesis